MYLDGIDFDFLFYSAEVRSPWDFGTLVLLEHFHHRVVVEFVVKALLYVLFQSALVEVLKVLVDQLLVHYLWGRDGGLGLTWGRVLQGLVHHGFPLIDEVDRDEVVLFFIAGVELLVGAD